MDSEDLVSVYTVNSATEAEIVRNSLKEAGIACEIGGETQAGLAGVLAIDILTHVGDVDRARKHLRLLRKEKRNATNAGWRRRKPGMRAQALRAARRFKN